MPGVVVLRRALDEAAQADVLRWCLDYGVARRRWLDGEGGLNAARQGRGRAYDAVERVSATCGPLSALLVAAAAKADARVDPVGAAMSHVLLLFYAKLDRGLGWHRDDGKNDGATLAPVVSLSLGCACDFGLKHETADAPTILRLDSGDAVLFGGPARHALHNVANIAAGSCPPKLRALCDAAFGAASPGDFRLNLTWRHAPELRGLEDTDRFHIFGGATRQFLDAARDRGLDAARAEANERRRLRKERKRGGPAS